MRPGQEIRYEDTCEITGIKNGLSTMGEILTFRDKDVIIATIQRSAKVTLHWQPHANAYVGSMGGVEFRSPGPKSQTYRTHR
ncbi:MAG: hypothetical protein RIA65_09245 [Woeseia sp.]